MSSIPDRRTPDASSLIENFISPTMQRYVIHFIFVIITLIFTIALTPMPNITQQIGQPAPNFTLPATTATQISLTDFRGRTILLVVVRHLG